MLKGKGIFKRAIITINILALLGTAFCDGRTLLNPEKYAPKAPEAQAFVIKDTEKQLVPQTQTVEEVVPVDIEQE